MTAHTTEHLRRRYGDRYKWLVLATVMIGTMASILSSTIVNVAIPDLSRHFALGQERAQWVSAGFMLAMTLSMLTTPWLLLRFGLRRTYTGAILLLLAGGVLGGFSIGYPMLLSMRVAEGLAAGVLQPIPAIVVLRTFDLREQGRAMGFFGFGVVLAPAIGPSVGGFLVEQFGWRSIFFVVVPFCLAVLLLIRRFLPLHTKAIGHARPLDWRGLALVGVSTVSTLNALVHLHEAPRLASLMLAVGLVSLAIFLLHLRSTRYEPLINLSLFRYPQFAMGALVAFIYGMGLFGSTYLLPVYMQMALQYTPSRAGLVLLPAGIALALTIPLAGRMADRHPPHVLVAGGLVLLTVSFLLMSFGCAAGAGTRDYFMLMGWAVVGRVGLGFVLPALSIGAMRGVDEEFIAQGSSTVNFLRQLGGAIGISLVGIVLEWRLASHHSGLSTAGPGGNGLPMIRGTVTSISSAAERVQAFNETFLFVAAVCAVAVLAAYHMRPKPTPAPFSPPL
ncbi:MAG: multidrug efflux MFS transporter MdrM [Burkholderiaceae bacterium]